MLRDEKRPRRSKGSLRPRLPADLRQVDWKAVNWARIDRCLARFNAPSLAALLAAAADSPGGGHRLPSLTVLWLRCLARPPAGAVRAAPAHLPQILAAARVRPRSYGSWRTAGLLIRGCWCGSRWRGSGSGCTLARCPIRS